MGQLGQSHYRWCENSHSKYWKVVFSNQIVSADDLPLSVSRETLQNSSFLRQIKQTILKRIIQSFTKLAEDEPDKFIEAQKVYGNVFKLGAVEDSKNKDKLIPLIRFATNQRNVTSLDEVGFVMCMHVRVVN